MSKFKTKYGYFTDDGKEFVITRPDTPRPWINIISNGDYGFTFSQTGGGSSWWGNANLARLTRWIQDIIKDEWGKYIFIRDAKSKKFWSLSWKPLCPKFDSYEARHGIGYSSIKSKRNGIRSSLTVFIPPKESIEIWKVTIRNESSKTRNLSVFSYLEWCLGNSEDPHREFQKTFMKTWFDRSANTLFARKKKHLVPKHISTGMTEYPCGAFNSVNVKPSAYDGDKERFFGMYGNFANAAALKNGRLSNTVGEWSDPISSLQVDIKLRPKEEKTLIFTLGHLVSESKARGLVQKYKSVENVDEALAKTKKFWDKLLSGVMVDTPDEAFNFLTNYWLKYQAISGRIWAKSAYYQSSGGYGFRDQLQDSQVFLPIRPELCKKQILMHAEHQFVDGTVHHWWHQLSTMGSITEMTDDLLWLAYILLSYLEETKDFKILDIKRPYIDGPGGTIYEHCCRAIDKVLSRFSKRGLPLMGAGDWCDGFNLIGVKWKGESVWLAQFLYDILLRFAPIAELKKERSRAKRYRSRAERMKKAVNKYCWDGEWYYAATRDDGKLVGSKTCEEAKIYLNSQTWAVISDIAPWERKEKAMNAVWKHLQKKYGPLLIAPGFTRPDENIGYISRYAPGIRENGGVYSHAACWGILAECLLGRGDKAYEMYSSFCPIKRGMEPDAYKAEPYVTPGNTNGPQARDSGTGAWTWYTGSGAWLLRVSTNWILGVRPTYDGLLIDPCVPKRWDRFSMKRIYGKATYEIDVTNPEGVSKGVSAVYLDGKMQNSNIIKDIGDGRVHKVKVVMGKV
ncbi:MAG: glycosyl transferase family 36 [Candidatus Omnitrophota bacterium]